MINSPGLEVKRDRTWGGEKKAVWESSVAAKSHMKWIKMWQLLAITHSNVLIQSSLTGTPSWLIITLPYPSNSSKNLHEFSHFIASFLPTLATHKSKMLILVKETLPDTRSWPAFLSSTAWAWFLTSGCWVFLPCCNLHITPPSLAWNLLSIWDWTSHPHQDRTVTLEARLSPLCSH